MFEMSRRHRNARWNNYREFIGFRNCTRLAEDERVWIALRNTAEDEAGACGIGHWLFPLSPSSPSFPSFPHSPSPIPHAPFSMPHSLNSILGNKLHSERDIGITETQSLSIS